MSKEQQLADKIVGLEFEIDQLKSNFESERQKRIATQKIAQKIAKRREVLNLIDAYSEVCKRVEGLEKIYIETDCGKCHRLKEIHFLGKEE